MAGAPRSAWGGAVSPPILCAHKIAAETFPRIVRKDLYQHGSVSGSPVRRGTRCEPGNTSLNVRQCRQYLHGFRRPLAGVGPSRKQAG